MVETASDLTFFEYFSLIMIRRMGWPKKRGWLRRKDIVDGAVLWIVHGEAVRIGMLLGANHPGWALRLLTEMSMDHTKQGVDHAITYLRAEAEAKMSSLSPLPAWKRIISGKSSSGGYLPIREEAVGEESLEWESILSEPYFTGFTLLPGQAMAWALAHPSEARDALAWHDTRTDEIAKKVLQSMGLPSDADLDRMCMDAVEEYELNVRKLPDYPGADSR